MIRGIEEHSMYNRAGAVVSRYSPVGRFRGCSVSANLQLEVSAESEDTALMMAIYPKNSSQQHLTQRRMIQRR